MSEWLQKHFCLGRALKDQVICWLLTLWRMAFGVRKLCQVSGSRVSEKHHTLTYSLLGPHCVHSFIYKCSWRPCHMEAKYWDKILAVSSRSLQLCKGIRHGRKEYKWEISFKIKWKGAIKIQKMESYFLVKWMTMPWLRIHCINADLDSHSCFI